MTLPFQISKKQLLLFVLFVSSLFPLLPWLEILDLKFRDIQFSVIRDLQPHRLQHDVVLVGIDEQSIAMIPEPMAMWHAPIGEFLKAMRVAQPSVIGLDIIFPDRSFDSFLPGNDRKLLTGLLAIRDHIPLVIGQTVLADGRVRPIYPPFVALAGGDKALALLRVDLDADRIARHYPDPAMQQSTLAGKMAQHLGFSPPHGTINFAIGDRVRYLSLATVLNWYRAGDTAALQQALQGHPVLLGSVLPFVDRYMMPVDLADSEPGAYLPGVLLHLQALRTSMAAAEIQHMLWLSIVLAAAFAWLLINVGSSYKRLMLCLPLFALLFTGSTWMLAELLWLPSVSVVLAALFTCLILFLLEYIEHQRERQRLQNSFGHYVSPGIMEEILDGKLQPELGGKHMRVCVLFADIRNFTQRSESLQPEQVIEFLNLYFEEVTQAIHGHGGTVDKFIGDGIMAFFGAPKASDDICQHAFDAAKEMLIRLHDLNERLAIKGYEAIDIGIGLHVGEAIIGHVGSRVRHEYTAIGDVVNVASRIEGLSKNLPYPLLCSEEMLSYGGLNPAGLKALGAQAIKGHTAVEVFGWREEMK